VVLSAGGDTFGKFEKPLMMMSTTENISA